MRLGAAFTVSHAKSELKDFPPGDDLSHKMMTCQHTTFALPDSAAPFGSSGNRFPDILFQPILDTFAHRVLAYECLVRTNEPARSARITTMAIQSAAAQNPDGLYLFPL